jgi:hypothetical protein
LAPLSPVLRGEGLGVRGEPQKNANPSSPALLPRGEGSQKILALRALSRRSSP